MPSSNSASSLQSDDDDSDTWKIELETTLLEGCGFGTIRNICKGRPIPDHLRKDVWAICLNIGGQTTSIEDFDEVFNLDDQQDIHDECAKFADQITDTEHLQLMSDLESIVTHFSRTYNLPFSPDNGWLDIIRGFLPLRLNRKELYAHFSSLHHRYIAVGFGLDNRAFAIFRLLLQYHEPELCLFLDTKRVKVDMYAKSWFTSLFAKDVSENVLPKLWDVYFLVSDPFSMFYMALVILINSKDQLLANKEASVDDILNQIQSILPGLEVNDIEDFCQLAQHYSSITPESFRFKYNQLLFGNAQLDLDGLLLINALCMPVSFHELLQAQNDFDKSVKFLLVDCRPPDQYNAGHLSNAFYLDSQMLLSNPIEFQTITKALLLTQKQAIAAGSHAAGEHICLMSSGREEEDGVANMVIAQFLQKSTSYISLAWGGYSALHDILGPTSSKQLIGHDPKTCLVCSSDSQSGYDSEASNNSSQITLNMSSLITKEAVGGLLSKVSSAVKTKSTKVKDNLVNYVKNEPFTSVMFTPNLKEDKSQRHVSRSDRVGKPYRNTGAVFSIDDQEEDERVASSLADEVDLPNCEIVSLELWLSKPDVLDSFSCRLVRSNGLLFNGHLLLTKSHLFVLQHADSKKLSGKMAYILHRRSLANIVKITSKKRLPEMLTFHYGVTNDEGETKLVGLDKAIIPNAGEAARLIKIQIQKILDSLEK